jgi:hypothetical protein
MHKRTLTRAAGVSPLWVRVTHLQRRAFLSERDARVALAQLAYASRSWSRARVPLLMCVSDRRVRYVCHGRLTPAAPGARRYIPSGNSAICGTQTHIHKSGGLVTAAPLAMPLLGKSTSRLRHLQGCQWHLFTKPTVCRTREGAGAGLENRDLEVSFAKPTVCWARGREDSCWSGGRQSRKGRPPSPANAPKYASSVVSAAHQRHQPRIGS